SFISLRRAVRVATETRPRASTLLLIQAPIVPRTLSSGSTHVSTLTQLAQVRRARDAGVCAGAALCRPAGPSANRRGPAVGPQGADDHPGGGPLDSGGAGACRVQRCPGRRGGRRGAERGLYPVPPHGRAQTAAAAPARLRAVLRAPA